MPPRFRHVLLAALCLTMPAAAEEAEEGGFGAGPTQLDYGSVVRGEAIERSILVENSKDATANVSVRFEDALGAWMSPDPAAFEMPPRSSRRVLFVLEPPADAPNGQYAGRAVVTSHPTGSTPEGETAVGVALAVRIQIRADVGGDQIERLAARSLFAADTEAGASLPFSMVFENRATSAPRPW